MDRNCYFFIGSVLNFSIKSKRSCMDKFRVFVYMLMDASLKQRIPCIMCISIFGAFSVGKKCALYMGKYGIEKLLRKNFLKIYQATINHNHLSCWRCQ